jgi:hypothetical protein
MDITKEIEEILSLFDTSGDYAFAGKGVRQLVIYVLKEVLESGHQLGGMGEYGQGWNDARVQMKMIVKEMIERWQNSNKEKS